MIYSVGENIYAYNSGIEFSQVKRTKALTKAGISAKIITRKYSRFLARDTEAIGLTNSDYINMYDYFQQAQAFDRVENNAQILKTVPLSDYHIIHQNCNQTTIEQTGRKLAVINIMPGTIGLVGDINYFNRVGNVAMTQYFDWRGFLSMAETYHPDGTIATQTFFDVSGNVVLEITHMEVNNIVQPTVFRLINYLGQDYVFDTEDQLFTFFLNKMNAIDQSTFIVDRPTLAPMVLAINNPKQTIAYIHEHHLRKYATNGEYYLKSTYQGVLEAHEHTFDIIAVATQQQVDDIKHDYQRKHVIALPASYVELNTTTQSTILNLQKIIYIGRLAPDKNISGILQVFSNIKKELPQTQLMLKGYFSSDDYQVKIQNEIDQLNLRANITFVGYNPNNEAEFKDASLFLSTSPTEGFGINMAEALVNGIPVACYGVPYVNDNLVVDNFNGLTVETHTPHLLAEKIITAFRDVDNIACMKVNAQQSVEEYHEKNLVNIWQQLLEKNEI